MLSSQEEMLERQRTLENDRRVRQQQEQGGTMHAFALADSQIPGRFAAFSATVVGSKSDIAGAYTAASAHQADPCGIEPPLGYRIDELEPCSALPVAQATGPTSVDAPPPLGQRAEVGSLSQTNGDPAGVHFPSPPSTRLRDAGSSSFSRRRL